MSFIPRLAVAAVAGVMLAAPAAAAYAQTPSPTPAVTPAVTPESTGEATATVNPSPTPTPTPSASATPSTTPSPSATPDATPAALKINARAESACSAATWSVQGLTDGVTFQVFENVDGQGWEPIATDVGAGYRQHDDAGVIAFRVVQAGKSNETGPIALFQCETTPAPTSPPTTTPTPTATPTTAPRGTVTAKYECGAAHFTNNGTQPVTIYAGTVDSDSIEAKFDLAPGKSRTVESTNKTFGWIAWENGVQAGDPAGYLGAPGEDLSCDEPDDSATPTPKPTATPTPGESRGLANTGGEDGKDGEDGQPGTTSTSITITINGTKISITAPGNGKPVITTNGETVTPDTPTATPTPTPTPTPSPTPTDDNQDDELAEQQAEQGPPAQDDQAVADEVFRLTNEFRAENNLPPFERDTCLDKTAEKQSEIMVGQMAEQDDIFHSDLEDADNCPGTEGVGENIAAGQPGAAEAVEDWKNSTEGHREAMLSTRYTHMGVGVTADNTYTQQFTTRDKSAQPAATVEPEPEPAAEPAVAVEAPATGLKAEQGLTPAATSLLRAVHQKWPNLEIGGVGQRPGESDHPSGNAIDIMTGGNACSPVGQKIADWAKSNADSLDVQYVIWCEKIWSVERASEGWRPNTGHQDHVHISVTGDTATKA